MTKWITRVARVLAGLFTIFCLIFVVGNGYSSMTYTYGDVPAANAWMVQPESVERTVIWSILAVVSGLFAIRGRFFLKRAGSITKWSARAFAGLVMVVCAILFATYAQWMIRAGASSWMRYPWGAGRTVVWFALAVVSGLFALSGHILPGRQSARQG